MNLEDLTLLLSLVKGWLQDQNYELDNSIFHPLSQPPLEGTYRIDLSLSRILVRNRIGDLIVIGLKNTQTGVNVGYYHREPWRDTLYDLHDPDVFTKLSRDFHL